MIRNLCALLLALIFAAHSVSAAVMSSQMQGAQQMLICSDIGANGLSTITLDATGKPSASGHHCPDCTAGHAALLPDISRLAPTTTAMTPPPPRPAPDRANTKLPPQSARDPPAFA